MNYNDLQNLIAQTTKTIQANEKLLLPSLVSKAKQAAEALPYDIPVITASQVLANISKKQNFITRDDFSKLIRSYATNDSKLSRVFAEELTKVEMSGPKTYQRSASESQTLTDDYNKVANPVLANALKNIFAENGEEAVYSAEEGLKAKKATEAQLTSIGLKPVAMEVFAGRDDVIVCQAAYETPKGLSYVLIPVEMSGGKALFPSLFLSQEGFKDITAEDLESHIVKTAGQKLRVDGEKLLSILLHVKKGGEVAYAPNEVEMAVIKMAGTQQILDPSASLYSTMEEKGKEVIVEAKDDTFANKLSKPKGIAAFVHGDKIVEAGRSAIIRSFAEMGYKGVQVKVADVSEEKIVYAAAIGVSTGVMIPITAKDTRPQYIIADGNVLPFEKSAIDSLVKESKGGDRRALAAASPSFEMTSQQLLDVIKTAADENDAVKVEDAMNVLAQKDMVTYKIALAYYMSSVSIKPSEDLKKVASQKAVEPVAMFQSYQMFFPKGQ